MAIVWRLIACAFRKCEDYIRSVQAVGPLFRAQIERKVQRQLNTPR